MSANEASIRRAASVSRAVDLLGQSLLAAPQPFGDLLDHPPALARVRLQLLQRLRDRLLRRAFELLAQPEHRRTLLVGRGHELGGLGLDPRLRLGDQLLLALLEPA